MGRRLALIIGNSVYQDQTLARLKAPDVDVGALRDILGDAQVGNFDDVDLFFNSTSSNVRMAISEFFSDKSREDLLVLYFSGHGVLDKNGRLYLAVKDTNHSFLRATAIPAAYIADEMDNSRSKRQVLILDCCHSGAFARGTKGVTGASVGTAMAFEGSGYGRVVLTATDATQYAWEGDQILGEAQSSLFTHYLVEGLRTGAADTNSDGKITINELYDYVYEQIIKQTPRQTPGKWTYKEQGEIVIALSALQSGQAEVRLPMPEVDEDIEQRLKKLYIDGLSAFWLEEWERAIRNFQAILDVRREYKEATAKLEEAQKQKRWQELYAKAQSAGDNKNWAEALADLETLTSEAGDFRDSKTLLERARRQKQLADLYTEARHLFEAGKWQAVIRIFAEIKAVDPEYPDPEGILVASEQKVVEIERQKRLEELYGRGLLEMEAGNWGTAQQLLARMQKIEPGYRDTEGLLARAEEEIEREKAEQRKRERVTTLYEEARGLARSHRWRQARDKMEEIRALDPEFPDLEEITAKAEVEVARERKEAKRQKGLDLWERLNRRPVLASIPILVVLAALGLFLYFSRDKPPSNPSSSYQASAPSSSQNPALTSDRDGKAEIYRMTSDGKVIRITSSPGSAESWEATPISGGQIVFTSNRDGRREIYHMTSKGEIIRLTFSPGQSESWEATPISSGQIVFTSNRDGKREIYVMDSKGKVVRKTYSPGQSESWEATPTSGGQIVFTSDRDGKREIYAMDSKGKVVRITYSPGQSESWEATPISGGQIVFTSNRDGRREIYHMTSKGEIIRLTFSPGQSESWGAAPLSGGQIAFTSNRDGKREIYVMNSEGKVVRITYSPGRSESWGFIQ